MTNTLYYGDNLHVLREHVRDASVDLIYLDPPFNSNANYNILFKSPEGHNSDAQIEAFEDIAAGIVKIDEVAPAPNVREPYKRCRGRYVVSKGRSCAA